MDLNNKLIRAIKIFYRAHTLSILGMIVMLIVVGAYVSWYVRHKNIPEKVAAAVRSKDFSECERYHGIMVGGVDYGTVCTNNIALNLAREKNDAAYCDRLDDVLMKRDTCKIEIFAAKANMSASPGEAISCDNFKDAFSRSVCLETKAIKEAIAKLSIHNCERERPGDNQVRCEVSTLAAFFAKTKNLSCTGLSDVLYDDCEQFVALSKKDKMTDCDNQFRSSTFRLACGMR